ncbi:MAG: TrmH family RNA methyltransferase, partial [bacterium]|nr:TrmH family RNA methyltransferase [bacterium]
IALEQSESAIDYKKVKPKKDFCLILGNEVTGIEPAILSLCDKIAEIPMRGKKESLNVSVATGVALYGILGI